MAESPRKTRTIDRVNAGLGRRLRAERRFKFYGLLAIFAGLAFLSLLFISIISKGYTAFEQTHMRLDLRLVEEDIDPAGNRAPEALSRADYLGVVKQSMRDLFPTVKGRRDKKDLYSLVSTGAAYVVRDAVMADPALIGTTQTLWVPADDDVDMFMKGHSTDVVARDVDGIASPTGTEGRIQVLSTANDFTAILAEIKEHLATTASRLEVELGWARNNLEEAAAEVEAARRALEDAENDGDAAAVAARQAGLAEAESRQQRYRYEVSTLTDRMADLRRRADAPGGEEALDADLPSYLVAINGGLVKATAVTNTGISGEVLLPLEHTRDAPPGQWQVIKYTVPEADRRLNDHQIAWLTRLQDEGRLELQFNTTFFTAGDSREPELAGIWGAAVGSFYVLVVTLALSFPIGVSAAIYLEEFAPKNRWTDLIEVNINNLAAVPSIVFGLLGLAVFINFAGLPRSAPLVGGLVLTLMTLPTIIIASRAALKSVPPSIREAALGVGASKTQMVFHHVLPLAMPGMLTGTIIGMAQALGESAPLLMIGMVAFIVDIPGGFTDPSTVLPVQIFLWADSPERAFVERTSAAIMVLLAFLITMNALAVVLRKRFERRW